MQILKVKKMTEGNVCIVVEYTSATDSFTETYDMRTSFNLDQRIKARLAELDELSDNLDKLKLGIWVEKKVDTVQPTPEQVKQMEYSDKLSELSAMKNDLNLGIISQTEYDTLLSEVKTLKAKL